ncbi:MAG: DUF535 family protein [Burkholderiales bacterium]|nr:DUF535 family protein [Burkholderiales bacterium]
MSRRQLRAARLGLPGGWWQGVGLMVAIAPSEVTGLSLAAESALAIWLLIWQGAQRAYPLLGPMSLLRRVRFMWHAWRRRREWRALRHVPPESALGRALATRGGMVHVIAWPYIHRAWSVRQRVDTVVAHYREVDRQPWLQVPPGQRAVLARLPVGGDGRGGELTLQLDQPAWMAKEGELTLSLFEGDLRLYSVAFSIAQRRGLPVIYVGAIQGRSVDGAQERYVELTRELHGCRPRDLLLQALLMLAESLRIGQVLAVCDFYRQHREPRLFASLDRHIPSANYDEIWRDRGGVETVDGFFAFDTAWAPRALETVPAKKRAMYRRRYELLGQLRDTVRALCAGNRVPRDLIDTPPR